MSDEQWSFWRDYVLDMADRIGLLQWRILLSDEPCDEHLLASCQVVRGRRSACIRLAADWAERSPEEQQHAITHELLHIWIEPVLICVEAAAEAMSQSAFKVLYHATDMQSEYAIDGIAARIAPLMPLPDYGEKA